MKLSALLAPLIAAKAPHDQIMAVVQAFEAEQVDALEQRRKADAERQARKRDRDMSRDVTLRHSDRVLVRGRDARVEDKTSNLDIEPQEKKQNAKVSDLAAFKAELEPDLGTELVDAFIQVRKAKRGALTGYAAKLFRGDAATVNMSVVEAATECVRSSWITVKPEYLQNRQRAGPQSQAPKPPSQADVFKLIGDRIRNGQGTEDSRGVGEVVPYLPAVRAG